MANVIIGGTATGATPLPAYVGTVDPVNDLIPIYDASSTSTVSVYRNQYLNISSNPVGLTDTQTLTNKTLTSPTISGPTFSGTLAGTYTIGGTPTFPSSVVTLTGTQTLTNKTLTSPTITSPTITNASITADSVAGFTVSNTGTIYGMSVSLGVLASAALLNTVNTAALQTGAVGGTNLSTTAITLGYAQITTNFTTTSTTQVQVTGLTATVTVPAGGRKVKITVFSGSIFTTGGTGIVAIDIWDGTVGTGTQLQTGSVNISTAGNSTPVTIMAVVTPASGSKTYNVGFNTSAFTGNLQASSTGPAFILVEAI